MAKRKKSKRKSGLVKFQGFVSRDPAVRRVARKIANEEKKLKRLRRSKSMAISRVTKPVKKQESVLSKLKKQSTASRKAAMRKYKRKYKS